MQTKNWTRVYLHNVIDLADIKKTDHCASLRGTVAGINYLLSLTNIQKMFYHKSKQSFNKIRSVKRIKKVKYTIY